MAKNQTETKALTEPKTSTNTKLLSPKAMRKARGEGTSVSLTIPGKLYKVLFAVSKLQGTRVSVLLTQSLEPIMSHAGVSVEDVERFLNGTKNVQAPKEANSPILDRLFGNNQTG